MPDVVDADLRATELMLAVIATKCGLTHVGTRHDERDDPIPGTEHGGVGHAITKSEWPEGKARFLG